MACLVTYLLPGAHVSRVAVQASMLLFAAAQTVAVVDAMHALEVAAACAMQLPALLGRAPSSAMAAMEHAIAAASLSQACSLLALSDTPLQDPSS